MLARRKDMSTWYVFSLFNPERQMKYYAISPLDEGGYGQVWDGLTPQGLQVAIKVIKASSDFTRDFETWFTDQQVHLRCLHHPHIVFTYDQFVSQDGRFVLVLERGGGSLSDLLNQGMKWTNRSTCAIATQILSALHYIHGLGVIHRDVSLKNIIWFSSGIFKLCDFGISKAYVQPQEFAQTFIGHKSYIPPELLYAGYSSFQSDIYQLGLVLLSMLTGSHPIPLSASSEETKQMILDGTPRQLAESLIATHGRTAELISIMLRRRDKYRFQTAQQAWTEFENECRYQELVEEIAKSLTQPSGLTLPPWLKD